MNLTAFELQNLTITLFNEVNKDLPAFKTARTIVYVVLMVIGAATILFGIFKFAARMKTEEGQKNKKTIKKQMIWATLLGAFLMMAPLLVSLIAVILDQTMSDKLNATDTGVTSTLKAFIDAFAFK